MKDFYNWLEERFDLENPEIREWVNKNQEKLIKDFLNEDYGFDGDYD